MRFLRLFILVLLSVLPDGSASAERRVALVLGVQNYSELRPLDNPLNDSRAMTALLEDRLGFDAVHRGDRTLAQMRRLVVEFAEEAEGADLAVLFFAGHGVEIAGRNYLLPRDAAPGANLAATALPLDEVVVALRAAVPNLLVLLDACRDDPFALGPEATRAPDAARGAVALARAEVSPGLRLMGRSEGVVYAFAAAPGEIASDGAGENSPFTEALLRHLATDGLDVRSALLLVQQDVYDRTRGAQLPYVESGLPRPLFLAERTADLPERDRLLLAMAELSPELRAQVERAAATYDTPLAPLYAAALEGGLAALGWEARESKLGEAAAAFHTTRERLLGLESTDFRVRDLRAEAEALLERGERLGALARLEAAISIDAGAGEASLSVAVDRRISEAGTRLARAGVHTAAFAYSSALADTEFAADLYARAAALAAADGRDPPRPALDGETRALRSLGELQLAIGDTGAALDAYQRWRIRAEARLAIAPDDPNWQRDLAVSLVHLSDVTVLRGDLAAALALQRRSLVLIEALADSDPGHVVWQRDLAIAHLRLGDLLGAMGDLSGAAEAWRRDLEISERLAAIDPDNPLRQRDLSISLSRLGNLLARQGDLAGAAEALEAAHAIVATLAAVTPDDHERQNDLAASHNRLGDLSMFAGTPAEAAAAYRTALAIRRSLAARDPTNAQSQHALALNLSRVGEALFVMGEPSAAEAFAEALAIVRRVTEQDPGNTDWQRDLAVAHGKLGDVLLARGTLSEAESEYRAATAISERLVAQDPYNTLWLRDLSISLDRTGDLHLTRGDPAAAIAAYRASLVHAEALAQQTPDNVEAVLDLVVVRYKLAQAGAEPRANLAAALNLLESLAADGRLPPAQAGWPDFVRDALAELPPG